MFTNIRAILGTALASYFEERGKKELRVNAGLWNDLHTYLKKTESSGCSYSDFATLYKHVRAHRPQNVLELGTGVSTLIIAHALKANGGGLVTSMEEGEKWYEMAKKLLPAHLEKYVDLHYSPAIEKTYDFFRGAGYKDIPNRPYEFVFVDGPAYLSNPSASPLGFNYDLIEVLKRSELPVAALIDSRHSTCYVYHQLLGDKVRLDYLRKLGVVLPSTKKDLLSGRQIVLRTMGRHTLKRPSILSIIRGLYW